MSRYEWLLFLHVAGAALLVSGAVGIVALQAVASRRQRPSEVALFLGLMRVPEVVGDIGAFAVLGLGIWLVFDVDYSFADGWIVAALVLWVVAAVLTNVARSRYRRARALATRLAQVDDIGTPEFYGQTRSLSSVALLWALAIVVVTILALMMFKPGAG